MGEVVLLSFTSAFNPTLIAVTTLMLLLPNPKGLMLGYYLGAMLTSITLGLLIVFSLKSSGVVSSTKHTLSPFADVVLGGLTLILAAVLASGRDRRYRERRAKKKEGKPEPRWQRELRRGSPRTTFVIGALLTLPGASYLAGLDRLSEAQLLDGRDRAHRARVQPRDAGPARAPDDRVLGRPGVDARRDRPREGVGRRSTAGSTPSAASRSSESCS